MKAIRTITQTGAILAVSWTLANGVNAQDRDTGTATTPPARSATGAAERETPAQYQSDVTVANRASKLVGMDVENRSGEKLGKIEDLVVDMNTGRISYAVLSVGGFLGVGEKYIAVPPSAFEFSAHDKKLVLNADKAKLERAHGFAKNNWPSVENPEWGAEGLWTAPAKPGQNINKQVP